MISSRCPRPIGNMESIAKIPVSKGNTYGFSVNDRGCGLLHRHIALLLMAPAPSISAPSASITLPKKAVATGTPARLPVRVPPQSLRGFPRRGQTGYSRFRRAGYPAPFADTAVKTIISPYARDQSRQYWQYRHHPAHGADFLIRKASSSKFSISERRIEIMFSVPPLWGACIRSAPGNCCKRRFGTPVIDLVPRPRG